MTALMVQGTSSWAGKSLLATALARYFSDGGLRVAPFKAQNMSNNARVVEGGEIGTAQWLQALAARVEPEVRMNPVLIKPEGENRSQVVLLGKPDRMLSRMPWRARAPHLWPAIEDSLTSLMEEFELVVIEGAGSPAEINLSDCDHANMRVAARANAPVILVADIDRGGAFAHLYGTWALVPEQERGRLRGFVLNKFRGDPSLLPPAPERLEEMTGVPVLGVIPWLDHHLPDEDGAASPSRPSGAEAPRVAVVRYPTASNLDEFKALEEVAELVWARKPSDLTRAELVVLPGSKHVAADIGWLRAQGLDQTLRSHLAAGGRVLAICGGLQMLGWRLEDPEGVDGSAEGLGVLPLVTVFEPEKTTRYTEARFGWLPYPWTALEGRAIHGYEIRHGRSSCVEEMTEALPDGLGFARGSILGVYLHGLFEDPAFVEAVLGTRPEYSLDDAFDELADAIAVHLDMQRIEALAGMD